MLEGGGWREMVLYVESNEMMLDVESNEMMLDVESNEMMLDVESNDAAEDSGLSFIAGCVGCNVRKLLGTFMREKMTTVWHMDGRAGEQT